MMVALLLPPKIEEFTQPRAMTNVNKMYLIWFFVSSLCMLDWGVGPWTRIRTWTRHFRRSSLGKLSRSSFCKSLQLTSASWSSRSMWPAGASPGLRLVIPPEVEVAPPFVPWPVSGPPDLGETCGHERICGYSYLRRRFRGASSFSFSTLSFLVR